MDGSSPYYCSVVFLVITMIAGGVALPLSLVKMFWLHLSITPVYRLRTAHELVWNKWIEEVEITECDTGQHSDKVQQRSSSLAIDE